MKKDKKLIGLCIVFVLLAGIAYQSFSGKEASESMILSDGIETSESDLYSSGTAGTVSSYEPDSNCSINEKEESQKLSVETDDVGTGGFCYVCGSVKKPGVYEFTEGDRITDLIKMADGLLKDAAPECLNLAKTVSDGEKIYVPSVKESKEQNWTPGETADSSETGSSETKEAQQVDLNTADAATLMTLPGIGQAKADSILAYREEHGSFHNIEEIKNIEGIKDGVFQKLKNLITVQS